MESAAPPQPENGNGRESPLFSFGVVADIQYADKVDRGTADSAQKLANSVAFFNSVKDSLSFVLTLGDIIDGNVTKEKTEADFEVVMNELSKLQVSPVFHVLGNHCLSMPREVLYYRLRFPKGMPYYMVEMHPGWQLVVLDSQDLSLLWPEGSEKLREGKAFFEAHPFSEENPQMVAWNGGIGTEQLEWLKQTLIDAERSNHKVVVAGHIPLASKSAAPTHVMWNYDQVLPILLNSPAVVAYFAGHYHEGGYAKVEGKHFVTIEGMVGAPKGNTAHATIDVSGDRLVINGHGSVTSRVLSI